MDAIREAVHAKKSAATLDFTGVTGITGGGLFPLYMAATRARTSGLKLFAIGLDEAKRDALRAGRVDCGITLVTELSHARMMSHQC